MHNLMLAESIILEALGRLFWVFERGENIV